MKITKPQRDERIRRIMELIGDNYMTFEIKDICKKEWGISPRTVDRYLKICYDFLQTSLSQKDKDYILLEYDRLITKFDRLGQFKIAQQYRFQRDKILGLGIVKDNININFNEQPLFPDIKDINRKEE